MTKSCRLPENIIILFYWTAPDVGFFFQRVPGAIGWLGCKGEGMEPVEQHNPRFRVDLTALRQGVLFHVNMALDFLNEE